MAELILKTDTLNQGREKLNAAITDAEKAKVDAGAAVSTSNTARQIAQTAEHKADSVQAQFDQVIIEGDSSVEAAAARVDTKNVSHPTLKARLDSEHLEVTAQLAETYKKMNKEIVSVRHRGAMISIIDDDGFKDVLAKWEPILREKNFKLTLAIITERPDNNPQFLTWADIDRLHKTYGVEIISHSHTHRYLGELSEQEVIEEFEKSTKILRDRGYTHDIIAYPFGSQSVSVRRIARQYCRAGIGARADQGNVSIPPLNMFNLPRPSLMYHDIPMRDVSEYTALIDEAIAKNAWLILMSHSQYNSFDSNKIKAIIDYTNSRNIEWVSVTEGLNRIGNVIDFGDYEARNFGYKYSIMDANGDLWTNSDNIPTLLSRNNEYSAISPITTFPMRKLTYTIITGENQNNVGFPDNQSGILSTFRFSSTGWNRQEFRPYNKNELWSRYAISDTTWSKWEKIASGNVVIHETNYDFGTVPANSGKNAVFDIFGIGTDDSIYVTFKLGLAFRVVPVSYPIADNQVRVRLENLSDSDIQVGNRPIKIVAIKT